MASTESHSQKPKPISTGPSQAEGIARFACRTKYEDLTAERRERLKVSVLDSLACAINALGRATDRGVPGPGKGVRWSGRSLHADRRRASQRRLCGVRTTRHWSATSTSWTATSRGAGSATPRTTPGRSSPPASTPDRSGKDFLTALAVAYQVEARLTASRAVHGPRVRPDDPARLLARQPDVSKALGLDEAKTAAAVEICGDSGIPLLVAADHPDLAMEGPLVVPGGPGVRPRGLPGVPRRDRSEVCDRGTARAGPGARPADPTSIGTARNWIASTGSP